MANLLSEYQKTDGEIEPNLIYHLGGIDSMTADKAYDQSRVYEAAHYALINKLPLLQLPMKQHHGKETYISSPSPKTVS